MAKLCAKGKAAAKRKFDVYPSAYANMYASAVCSGKIKPGGKKKIQKKSDGGSISQDRKNGNIKTPSNVSRGCGMVMDNRRKQFKVT
jgi:hypothetical protein